MIIFNLKCKQCSFEFEGWFDSSVEFEKQKKNKLISCPSCHCVKINKSLMSPNLFSKSNSKHNKELTKNTKKNLANNINKYKEIIEKNFDYVGDNFTEEAKKMKYGEIKERPIYGDASIDQTKDLLEEEIDIVPLPWPSNKKIN